MLSLWSGSDMPRPPDNSLMRLPPLLEIGLGPVMAAGELPQESARRGRVACGIAAGMAASGWLMAAGDLLAGMTGEMVCCGVLLWIYWRAMELGGIKKQRKRRILFAVMTITILLAGLSGLVYVALHPRPRVAAGIVAHRQKRARKQGEATKSSGLSYAGVILWPKMPHKKKLIVPSPLALHASIARIRKPLVIPFDGAYWYFHAPAKRPGPRAHVAHGNPTQVEVRSSTRLPLIMEAHQSLRPAIDLNCCRELDLAIRNNDDAPGAIRIAVELIDTSTSPEKSLDLGAQPVLSSEPPAFSLTRPAVNETLRYSMPGSAPIRQFNEIEVVFLPSPERNLAGARIAVQSFRLLPAH